MDIRNTKRIQKVASHRLENTPGEKRISSIFAGVMIGINVLVVLLGYLLGLKIDQSGGLSKIGLRTTLSAVQTMLPIVQTLVGMCLELGYVAAMLRIARGQYTSPYTLRMGFDRFWTLMRQQLILTLFYMGIAMAAVYISSMIYAMTPLSKPAMEMLTPLLSETSILNSEVVLDEAIYTQLAATMLPTFIIMGVIYIAMYIPVTYRFRMASYVLIDNPGMGAVKTLRQSRELMRGNAVNLFKLDIRFWWYYLAELLITAVCYGDQILLLLGVELPISQDMAFFVFYGLYWVLQFLLIYFLRGRIEVCYALAYEAIKPEEKTDGVVLGNIFQM